MDEKISRRDRKRQEQEQQRKKKGKLKPIIISIISVILLATGAFALYTIYNFNNSTNKGYKKVDYLAEVDPNFNKFSILMLGIDENDSRAAEGQTRENSRTDSMILATVNKQKNRMDMVSIPRDSLTLMRKKEDEGDNSAYFFDKITHAHSYNDVKGTVNAVENLLDTPINFYVLINFKAFEQAVDSFGGIDLYVPFDMDEQNANGEMNTIKLTKINEVINIAGDNTEHNLTSTQIASAIKMFINNDMKIVSHRIDGYNVMHNGVYYYYPKPSSLLYTSSALRNNLDLELPKATDLLNIYYQNHIQILEKEYKIKNLLPRRQYGLSSLVHFDSDDQLTNLPDRLSESDLNNDPTVSNENRPDGNDNNNKNN